MTAEETEVEVVLVDSPEKWTEAKNISRKVKLDTLAGMAEFQIRAMSGTEYTALTDALPMPEAPLVQNTRGVPTPNAEDKNFVLDKAEVKFKRWTAYVDACWKELPGTTIDLKAQWASENLWHRRELESLSEEILGLSGFNRARPEASKSVPMLVDDPKKWAEMTQRSVRLIFERHEGDRQYDLAFDLKPISRLVSSQIEQSCPEPEIPEVPAGGIGGRVKRFVKNENDPRYKAQVQSMIDKRIVLVIEASTGWKIPGDDFDKKTAWLKERPAGEIIGLYNYLVGVVNDFRTRADFL